VGQGDPVQYAHPGRFGAFFARGDTFALGASTLPDDEQSARADPGSRALPRFVKNRSEQFAARLVMVESCRPFALLRGMAGNRMPVPLPTARGGPFDRRTRRRRPSSRSLRRQRGAPTAVYPSIPRVPDGITGLTTADGRFTILMPHPERAFRTVQLSGLPLGSGRGQPLDAHFRNARKWVA